MKTYNAARSCPLLITYTTICYVCYLLHRFHSSVPFMAAGSPSSSAHLPAAARISTCIGRLVGRIACTPPCQCTCSCPRSSRQYRHTARTPLQHREGSGRGWDPGKDQEWDPGKGRGSARAASAASRRGCTWRRKERTGRKREEGTEVSSMHLSLPQRQYSATSVRLSRVDKS
jgi:hypothetical protein